MVPYVICYNPALILVESTPLSILIVTATTLIGLFALAAAFEGYLFAKVPFVLRLVFAAGGILLIAPETVTDVIGQRNGGKLAKKTGDGTEWFCLRLFDNQKDGCLTELDVRRKWL